MFFFGLLPGALLALVIPQLPIMLFPWTPGLLPFSDSGAQVVEFLTAALVNGYLWFRLLTWRAGPLRLGLAAGLAGATVLLCLPHLPYLGGALAGGGGCGTCHRLAVMRTALLPWALGGLLAVRRSWACQPSPR